MSHSAYIISTVTFIHLNLQQFYHIFIVLMNIQLYFQVMMSLVVL